MARKRVSKNIYYDAAKKLYYAIYLYRNLKGKNIE